MASCAPSALLKAAKCFPCLTVGQARAVKAYLACQWANKGGGSSPPAAPTSITIALNSTFDNIVVQWTQGTAPTTNQVWRSKNGGAFVLFATVAGGVTTVTDNDVMPDGDLWTYEVRGVNANGNGPFSTTVSIGHNLAPAPAAVISYPDLILIDGNGQFLIVPMVTFSAPNLVKVTGNLNLNGATNMTTLQVGSLKTVGGFIDMTGCNSITSVNFPALQTVGGDLVLNPCSALVGAMNFPNLVSVGGTFVVQNTPATSVNIGSLVSTVGQLDFINTNLVTIAATSLVSVGADLLVFNNVNLVTFSAPSLTTVGAATNFSGDTALANVSFPSIIFTDGTLITFDSCALVVGTSVAGTGVNGILHRGVVSGTGNCDYELANGANAAPSDAGGNTGATDKLTLQGSPGQTVNTN